MNTELLPSMTTVAAAALLFTPAFALFIFQTIQNVQKASKQPPLPFPPGPEGEFFFGNARQMPEKSQWLAFANWGKKYGKS